MSVLEQYLVFLTYVTAICIQIQAMPADQKEGGTVRVMDEATDPGLPPTDNVQENQQQGTKMSQAQEREEIDWGHGTAEDVLIETMGEEEEDIQGEGKALFENDGQEEQQILEELREQIGVIDPEEIMHKGDHHDHDTDGKGSVHSEDEEKPCVDCQELQEKSAASVAARREAESEEINNIRPSIRVNVHDPQARAAADFIKEQAVKEEIGPTFEQAVHGSDHVHDNLETESDGLPGKVVKYQDIVDLGLGEEILRGIDLSQLLEQEQREGREWKKFSGSIDDEDSLTLRQRYLEKLSARIKFLEPPDPDTAEWDQSASYDDTKWVSGGQRSSLDHVVPHPEESQLEHEMEMWGSTAPKGNRKPYSVIYSQRGRVEENGEEQR